MNEHDVFGRERFEEAEPMTTQEIDIAIESGDLTMEEAFGPGGEDDPMPHMDNYFTGW